MDSCLPNQWLKIAADSSNDKITIGHTYSALKAWEFAPDATDGMKKTGNGNSFTIPTFKTDNAGHIVESGSTTYYIPHTFKTISVIGDDATTDSIQTNGSVAADDIVDTLTIAPQNKWIDIAADATNDKITIGHKHSPETNRADGGDASNQTPNFGSTFKVPNYETDLAGHITKVSSHTVTIPQNSYSETASRNVLTSISLDKATGTFTGTRAYVGTLALNEYEYASSLGNHKIVSTDTINEAFAKAEKAVEAEIAARETAIATEQATREQAINDTNEALSDLNDVVT